MKKILIIFGTRPEAIKMAPIVKEFLKYPKFFDIKVCVTAQHREMLDQVLHFFDIKTDFDLNLMKPNQNLYSLTSSILNSLKSVLEEFKPDYVFVHGDTTTTMASSIASFYFGAKLCHIEAGLRTYNKLSPFPEELNRQITSRISDYHFTPTKFSYDNLIRENISKKKIIITGNTVIDALYEGLDRIQNDKSLIKRGLYDKLNKNENIILVTGHRRENHGKGFINICNALIQIAYENKNFKIIYPVHPNPKVQEPVNKYLKDIDNILLINPLSYPEFIWLMNKSKIIITDSGGIQEEAPSLGKPVLVLRDTTERQEAVESGTVILVGTNKNKIVQECNSLIQNQDKYNKMSKLNNPYGNGTSSKKIINFLKDIKHD